MHLCWGFQKDGELSFYKRLDFAESSYSISVNNRTKFNKALPKILKFSHERGSIIRENETFWFSFVNDTHGYPNIEPSHNPYDSSYPGKILVYQSSVEILNQSLTHANSQQNQGHLLWNKAGEQRGKCFIEGLNLTRFSILHIQFYTNSFSYTDGDNRYYLFGDTNITETAYVHWLTVGADLIKPSNASIDLDEFMYLDGIALSNRSETAQCYTFPFEEYGQTWYKSISLDLYMTGALCERPTATVRLINMLDGSFFISNLDLKDWTSGKLMANATFVLNGGFDFTIEQFAIKIGDVVRNETWATSYDSKWASWSTEYPFYDRYNEQWVKYCKTIRAYKAYYKSDDHLSSTMLAWTLNCPFSYYGDSKYNCHKWFDGCVEWTGPNPEDCTACDFPHPFILGNDWVSEWPESFYEPDYVNYECIETNYYDSSIVDSTPEWQNDSLYSKDNLSVEISLTGVSSTIMINAGGTLFMSINNKRGNITSYNFIQVTPTPDPNDELTNLFPLIVETTNQYLNETLSVDLNPDTIENYATGTQFKVKAEVENDWGDKAIDFITFILNPPPTIGTATITWASTPWTVLEDITVTLTGDWYSENSYEMELYIKISLELPDGTTVLLVPETRDQTVFNFVLPVVSYTNETMEARLLIAAINSFGNTNTLSKSLTITNTLTEGYECALFSHEIDLTSLSNLTMLSSQMQLILSPPTNCLSQDGILWKRDNDWGSHGSWSENEYNWKWSDDFTGIDWSIHLQMYVNLEPNVNNAIEQLLIELSIMNSSKRSSIQMWFEILVGLLTRPEVYTFEQMLGVAEVLERVSNLDDSTLLSFSYGFDEIFIKAVSYYYTKAMYELSASNTIANPAKELHKAHSHDDWSSKLEWVKNYSDRVWIATEKFLIKTSSKLNLKNSLIHYITAVGSFKLEYITISTKRGMPYSIDRAKNYSLYLPLDDFSDTILSSIEIPLRVLSISWYVNPQVLSSYIPASDTLSVHIVLPSGEELDLQNKSIHISMPYVSDSYFGTLGCSSFHLSFSQNSIEPHTCYLKFIDCEECQSDSIFEIHSNQLSSFVVTEASSQSFGSHRVKGVSQNESRLTQQPIHTTLFTFWCVLFLVVYIIGLYAIRYCEQKEHD